MTLRTTLVVAAALGLAHDASAGGETRGKISISEVPAAGGHVSKEEAAGGHTISGPYVHGNLAVYLIHGGDKLPGVTFLTLDEGLASKKVVVHETGSVAQLAIENLGKVPVFIQAGEIVKGQGDRLV